MKMTHTGIVEGNDNRTPDNYKRKVLLRDTTPIGQSRLHTDENLSFQQSVDDKCNVKIVQVS